MPSARGRARGIRTGPGTFTRGRTRLVDCAACCRPATPSSAVWTTSACERSTSSDCATRRSWPSVTPTRPRNTSPVSACDWSSATIGSLRVLREAGAATASVIVLTGDDDLGNLNTALAAAEINPHIRVVIRMFDQELGAQHPELFPDAVALSSSAVAAPGFVSAAIDGETGSRFRLAGKVLTSRPSADAPRGERSIPIARLRAHRSAEILPDDAGPGEPDLLAHRRGRPR